MVMVVEGGGNALISLENSVMEGKDSLKVGCTGGVSTT
jgi:hypothetical protein